MSQPLVLCYHVVSEEEKHPLAVDRHTFESQVASLLRRGRSLHVTFDDGYAGIVDAIALLEDSGVARTVFVVTSCAADGSPPAPHSNASSPALGTLQWSALGELAARGVEIGSHSVTHPHLTNLGDDELRRELRDSRAAIEDELSVPCRSLAYPYGDFDARVSRAARDAGYERAFAARPRFRHDPFALPRVSIFAHDGAVRFWVKTAIGGRL